MVLSNRNARYGMLLFKNRYLLAVLFLNWLIVPAMAQQTETSQAIKRGVEYLKREQQDDGSWNRGQIKPFDITPLCTLALLESGVAVEDESMTHAISYLRKESSKQKYTKVVALTTMVFSRIASKDDRAAIERNNRLLTQYQVREGGIGGWGYSLEATERKGYSDPCNTEWALLALNDARVFGVKPPDETWLNAWEYWKSQQQPDGSWGYQKEGGGSGSMTCAGIHSLVIIGGRLAKRPPELDQSIKRAQGWLENHYAIDKNPNNRWQMYPLYYLYGLSRVGTGLDQRLVGDHDWYQEGVDLLTDSQEQAGNWKTRGALNGVVGTSFALLFLSSKTPADDGE